MNIPDVNKFDVPAKEEECEALTNNSANPHRRLSSPFSKMKSNIPNRIGKEIEVSTEDADSKSFADVQIRCEMFLQSQESRSFELACNLIFSG